MLPLQISNPPTKLAEEDAPSPTKNEPFFSHRLVRGQSEGPDPAKRPSEGAVVRSIVFNGSHSAPLVW